MGVSDLKQRLSDIPGIHDLTMTMIAGRQQYNIGGKVISVDAGASDLVAQEAIRAAMSSDAIVQIPPGQPFEAGASAGGETTPAAGEANPISGTSPATASPSAALIPVVNVAPPDATVQPKATQVTTSSPASHALTIKDVLTQHSEKLNQILEAQIAQLQLTLGDQVDTVVNGTNAVIARSKQHTDEFRAILGQFTNLGTE